jgi:hypothetical protein
MMLLKISESSGHFLNDSGEYQPIDKIKKEDLLRLLNLVIEKEVTFDEYDETKIKNQAHQIVYKSVLDKLKDLNSRKQKFIDETERLYLKDYEKYKADSSSTK